MPRLTSSLSTQILNRTRSALTNTNNTTLPHFQLGQKELYFPQARIILLRPNAKHTPYQAKFIVPKSFNKLDLRDYLFHVYGLRCLNVTTQLLNGKYTRISPYSGRFRGPQIKKMTVDMEEPFIWPREPGAGENDHWNKALVDQLNLFSERQEAGQVGSDRYRPESVFPGLMLDGRYGPGARPFISRRVERAMGNRRRIEAEKQAFHDHVTTIESFVHPHLHNEG